MKVEYGHVIKYNAKRGFGFVTQTFDDTIEQGNKDVLISFKDNVWFHISTIKYDFPDLAQQLDDGLGKDVYFWYLIDTSEREKVSEIWLDGNNIPNRYRQDLISCIEKIWNSDDELSLWLEKITIDLVGKTRKDELHLINLCKRREADELRQAETETKIETNVIQFEENIYNIFPEDLLDKVLWVADPYRKNPISLEQGGTRVIVEYCNGNIYGYSRIKYPPAYIDEIISKSIYCSLQDYRCFSKEDKIEIAGELFFRIFVQHSEDGDSCFIEVWNNITSEETPADSLRRFYRPPVDTSMY